MNELMEKQKMAEVRLADYEGFEIFFDGVNKFFARRPGSSRKIGESDSLVGCQKEVKTLKNKPKPLNIMVRRLRHNYEVEDLRITSIPEMGHRLYNAISGEHRCQVEKTESVLQSNVTQDQLNELKELKRLENEAHWKTIYYEKSLTISLHDFMEQRKSEKVKE